MCTATGTWCAAARPATRRISHPSTTSPSHDSPGARHPHRVPLHPPLRRPRSAYRAGHAGALGHGPGRRSPAASLQQRVVHWGHRGECGFGAAAVPVPDAGGAPADVQLHPRGAGDILRRGDPDRQPLADQRLSGGHGASVQRRSGLCGGVPGGVAADGARDECDRAAAERRVRQLYLLRQAAGALRVVGQPEPQFLVRGRVEPARHYQVLGACGDAEAAGHGGASRRVLRGVAGGRPAEHLGARAHEKRLSGLRLSGVRKRALRGRWNRVWVEQGRGKDWSCVERVQVGGRCDGSSGYAQGTIEAPGADSEVSLPKGE
eukprot:ctg_616.g277